jgi:hypothetical protein
MAIRNWMLEALVAKKIGVARSVIAAYRKNLLERDRDWRLERNQAGKTMKSDRQRGASLLEIWPDLVVFFIADSVHLF